MAATADEPTPAPGEAIATARATARRHRRCCPRRQPPRAVERRHQRKLHTTRTHHGQASRWAIQAVHHDGDDEHIPDPSRPQADVDHSGHTRGVFLARHQQIQLYLAPIVAHFKSKPYHRLIWIFMAHSTDLDPRMDQRQGNTDLFLLRPIRPSIFAAARCLQPRLHRLPSTTRDCHHAALMLTCNRLPSVRILPPVSIAGCPLCHPSAIAQSPLPMTRPPAFARAD
ncbi:hypothetical protein ACLOJK_006906 [Asimina triloba]